MKSLKITLTLAVFTLFPLISHAGSVKCPEVGVILSGIGGVGGGHTYQEIVELHKKRGGKGYNGKWQVHRFTQINTYPHPVKPPISTSNIVQFGHGMSMKCDAHAGGNQVISVCTGGNLTLDVVNNRIGSRITNIWIGKIQGDHMSLKFHKENPFEPTITGTIKKIRNGRLKLNISQPSSNQKYVYDTNSPGKLKMTLKASVTPPEYKSDVKWTIPEIPGSTRTVTPASATGDSIEVEFEDLPSSNSSFGKKTIQAEVDAELCKAEDTKNVTVFFPRDADNNPGGSEPNWYYYWSQTSAKKGPAKYGGLSGQCASGQSGDRDNLIGYYRYIHRDPHYFICDLRRLGNDFKFTAVRLRTNPFSIDSEEVKGIDTFAVASYHEYGHYKHFKDWWFQFNPNPIRSTGGHMKPGYDKDGDFIPNTVEPGINLDPNTKYTLRQYDPNIDLDDEEYLTWLEEAKWVIGSANNEDWAKPGKQWR